VAHQGAVFRIASARVIQFRATYQAVRPLHVDYAWIGSMSPLHDLAEAVGTHIGAVMMSIERSRVNRNQPRGGAHKAKERGLWTSR
jgi:hypothetical protein